MRVLTALGVLAFSVSFGLAVLIATACGGQAKSPIPEETLLAHKRACVAGGSAVAMAGQMTHQPCAVTAQQLRDFVAEDQDCRAFFGDAGVAVDESTLCGGSDAGN